MNVLGIDPGSVIIGYALVAERRGNPLLVSSGFWKCVSPHTPDRLKMLHERMVLLMHTKKPDIVAVEKLFFSKNTKTALSVSEARGVILLTTALAGITVREYTPLQVKKGVTGDGTADKTQLEKMVRIILPETRSLHARDDVFDAIGVALTCFFEQRYLLRHQKLDHVRFPHKKVDSNTQHI